MTAPANVPGRPPGLKANPACRRCSGNGLSYPDQGGRLGPCVCLGWKGDMTLAQIVEEAGSAVLTAELVLTAAKTALELARADLEAACKTCSGTKKVTVGAKTFPCPATGCGVPPCETCKGAGKVTIGETEYPCPEAKCTAKGVGR
jgi:hypothetical protein